MTGSRKYRGKSGKHKFRYKKRGKPRLDKPPISDELRRLADKVGLFDEDDIIIINEFGEDESARHWALRHRLDLSSRQELYGEQE